MVSKDYCIDDIEDLQDELKELRKTNKQMEESLTKNHLIEIAAVKMSHNNHGDEAEINELMK
jgi:hypothetical protein